MVDRRRRVGRPAMAAGAVDDDTALPRRTPWRRALVSGLFLVVRGRPSAWALAGQWSEIVDRARRPAARPSLIGSLGLALAGVYMSFLLWRGTLAVLGAACRRRPAARLFFPTQLGKYLPGAVWPVVAQMRMGRELGVPRQRMAPGVPADPRPRDAGRHPGRGRCAAGAAGGRGPGGAVRAARRCRCCWRCSCPGCINSLLDRALRVLRRPGLERPLAGRDIARGVLWAMAFWLVYGGHVWLLAVGLGADPLEALPVAIGGFAIAFSLGPLLVVLPAGAGVREAVMVVLFSGLLHDAGGDRGGPHVARHPDAHRRPARPGRRPGPTPPPPHGRGEAGRCGSEHPRRRVCRRPSSYQAEGAGGGFTGGRSLQVIRSVGAGKPVRQPRALCRVAEVVVAAEVAEVELDPLAQSQSKRRSC